MSPAGTPATPCAHCGRVGGPRIVLSKRDGSDNETFRATLCGMACLAQWSYANCVNQGVRLVFAAQGALARIKSFFGGGG